MTDNRYEYKEVEFTDLIEMLQAIKDGGVYIFNGDEYNLLNYEDNSIVCSEEYCDIARLFERGGLYKKIEIHWWEKHVGSLVAIRDHDIEDWMFDVFKGNDPSFDHSYICRGARWKQIRPLTQSEKDAIITKD